jgi:maleylpyruvate isomerase
MKPDQTLAWMRDGTVRLLAAVAGLTDAALEAPTALPGWNRRYLLAHVAANADALRNLVHWARTGEERPMYASPAARDAGIAAGAKLPAADLRAWVESSAASLAADLDSLGDGPAWAAKITTAQGLTRSASEIPWMRVREVYIHLIDLAVGTTFADLPEDFLTALLDDVTIRRP